MIVPSIWWDPYPTVIYEAFDAARPVLGAGSGGIPESVADGEHGLLHPAGDAVKLATQVLQLHHNPGQSIKLGANGRRWLLANSGGDFWWTRFNRIVRPLLAA